VQRWSLLDESPVDPLMLLLISRIRQQGRPQPITMKIHSRLLAQVADSKPLLPQGGAEAEQAALTDANPG
jgi:hypothetical protein